MILSLAFKNVISRKSSAVIVLFISFAVALMLLINSVFDSTEHGIEQTYTSSFTGDLTIRPKDNMLLCLFGDQTPITGELSHIETLKPYTEIVDYLNNNPLVDSHVSQVTGAGRVEANGHQPFTYIFGVNGEEYTKIMNAIEIVDGSAYGKERGIMLPVFLADWLEVKAGDMVQFTVADGPHVRIRAAKLSAIYKYPVENEIFESIAIADPYTVCSLLDMNTSSENIEIEETKSDLLDDELDWDDLFMTDDVSAEDIWDDSAATIEDLFASNDEEVVEEIEEAYPESTTWNFICGKVAPGQNKARVIRSLNRDFKKKGWPVEAVNWRNAAGSTAMYLYWIRLIFNVGIIIILFAGFIIINNTLVVNVLNRTREIGTLRAQGGTRLFVSLECMTETFILSLVAGILGSVIGCLISKGFNAMNITISNSFLIQLFGGTTITSILSVSVVLKSMMLALVIGLIGWIYPVRSALKVTPVKAMQGGE